MSLGVGRLDIIDPIVKAPTLLDDLTPKAASEYRKKSPKKRVESNFLKLKTLYIHIAFTKCWAGGVGPVGACCDGMTCYNGNNFAADGYCVDLSTETPPTCCSSSKNV